MGQYWMPVNLDKKEFIHPHKLGSGMKLWEQLANPPGVGAALIILTAAMPVRRGGGDLDLDSNWHGPERKGMAKEGPVIEAYQEVAKRTIGRWAGDRIALVGDYAEDGDLPKRFKASLIYGRCSAETKEVFEDKPRKGKQPAFMRNGKYVYFDVVKPAQFRDITDDVCRVIEHELNGKFTGEGWREFKQEAA